jgi:ribosomal protein L37AE/L43A
MKIFGILCLAVIFCIICYATRMISKGEHAAEAKRYNRGVCVHCGKKLHRNGVNRIGSDVWKCPDCGYRCDVSFQSTYK